MVLDHFKLAIICLGYVGPPLAVEFGKQRPVIGWDVDERRIGELQTGKDSTLEITAEKSRDVVHSRFTTDLADFDAAKGRLLAGEWKKGGIPKKWDGKTGERIAAILERLLVVGDEPRGQV